MQSHLFHHRQPHQVSAFAGRQGYSRLEIQEKYIFFTAGSCGPCRFGMYESEYRLALENAGYERFRIVLYQAEQAIKAAADNPGLKFTVDFNLGALNMLNLGDVINDLSYRIRPFEAVPGSTDRAIADAVDQLSHFLETASNSRFSNARLVGLPRRCAAPRSYRDFSTPQAKF